MAISASTVIVSALAVIGSIFSTVAVAQSSTPGVHIIYIQKYFDRSDYPQVPMIYRNPSAETKAKAQREIRDTPGIRELLESRGIRFERVNAVTTALNGGKVVYVD